MLKTRFAPVVALLLILSATTNVWATRYNSLYVFGDSLSDIGSNPSAVLSIYNLLGGNCDPLHPCPPYFDGRYSNGPVASERLADKILPGGGQPTNYFNFAVSGSTSGIGNFGDMGTATTPGLFGLPGMTQQVLGYLSTTPTPDPDALYMVWGGANDFLTLDSPIAAAQNVAAHVASLAAINAASILVPNIPDLSLTPYINVDNPGLAAVAQGYSLAFNAQLATELGTVRGSFPDTTIIEYDIFALFNDVVANPSAYGLDNVTHACLLVGCSNPEKYLFWDDIHPTTRGHAVVASKLRIAVPEPASVVLICLGLAGLRLRQRSRLQRK